MVGYVGEEFPRRKYKEEKNLILMKMNKKTRNITKLAT